VGENICQLHIKGLITRIYRELKKLNSPKINEPIKNGQVNLTELSQKKKLKWPKKYEKMLTISNHKGNGNQNYTKIPPHPC
jgi:hypothetical protein